ncbi:MAG: TFIIB-type zinc ribbon-containing protein, partial [Promethearchaeota archaeon]
MSENNSFFEKDNINSDGEVTICSECGSAEITNDETRGELICRNCGMVLSEKLIDQGPEWRAFNLEER